MRHVESALSASRVKARATLIRLLKDIDHAEDALQWACLKALDAWTKALPKNPVAWLVTVGRNRFIDEYRKHEKAHAVVEHDALECLQESTLVDKEYIELAEVRDDSLRLIFTCCHPCLSPEAQIALTLRIVCDLSTEEIARAFLIEGKTLEKRITRAKEKIKQKQIPYEIPGRTELAERKSIVLSVVYLIFNEGYLSVSEEFPVNEDLCNRAVLLARRLVSLFTADAEVAALLSLMLLLQARFPARLDADSSLLDLEQQDREKWDRSKTEEACALLEKVLLEGQPGPYQLQASIAALHNQAECFEDTDWQQIVLLYRMLESIEPSPVIKLNRVVAVYQAEGMTAAWELFNSLDKTKELKCYGAYHAVKAHLLERKKHYASAIEAYEQALDFIKSPAEKKYINHKISELRKKG